jgi:hypothetical protein
MAMEEIKVDRPGTIVYFNKLFYNGRGVITTVGIKAGSIIYEVAYFKDGTLVSAWVPQEMLEIIEDPTQLKIGFKP